MRKLSFVVLVFAFLWACKKDKAIGTSSPVAPAATTATTTTGPGTVNITGKAQKGPYKNGSSLVVYELNSTLGQTGKSFSSVISDDAGNFALSNIGLATYNILITANGYYYQEHFNQTSSGPLYLEAVSDIAIGTTINVNLLTHIIKPRIEDLVSKGSSFSAARTQAQAELKQIMGVTSGSTANFETIDIANDGFLFAMSLLFQRRTAGYIMSYNYAAELGSLLSNFRNDFKNNGLIDNTNIIDTLIYNANRIQLIDAKDNLQNYYSSLGLTIISPNFEPYIYLFQKKYGTPVYTSILFPDSALYMTDMGPPSKMPNLLKVNKTIFPKNTSYLLSGNVPCDSSLVINFTKYNGNGTYVINQPYYGWKMANIPSGFALTCQRKNFQNGLLLMLQCSLGGQDSAKIEYFQNNSTTPYFTKIIHWQ